MFSGTINAFQLLWHLVRITFSLGFQLDFNVAFPRWRAHMILYVNPPFISRQKNHIWNPVEHI
jgi:hypothetical protein